MKRSLRKALIVAFMYSVSASGCGEDSAKKLSENKLGEEGEACTVKADCVSGLECVSGKCAKADSAGDCSGTKCKGDETCISGSCIPNIELCGGKKCGQDETCVGTNCVNNSRVCGGVVCGSDEICQNDRCVKDGDCGGIQCEDDEICYFSTCRAAGDCGGVKCYDTEICYNNACHNTGDCGGLECNANEKCRDGECVESGDCGGYACKSDEVCIMNACYRVGECDGIACEENQYCDADVCYDKEYCGDQYCNGDEYCNDGVCEHADFCLDNKGVRTEYCGSECCSQSQFCGSDAKCCEETEACGSTCCGEGEKCENEICHIICDGVERCELEDGSEVCCAAGEICASNKCYKPSDVKCIDNYMCENDEYCDTATSRCLPQPAGEVCQLLPKGGEVEPTLLWYWGETAPDPFPNYDQVMSSPMVADINNDGLPEVVFNSYLKSTGGTWEGNAIVRVLNGQTGELIASSDAKPLTDGGSMVALANLDDDPYIEIVTCAADYKLIAYDFVPGDAAAGTVDHLEVKWHATQNYMECGQSGPGVGDFNGDGKVEVYGRYTIHDGLTGEVIAHVACDDSTHTHRACDYSVALDVDDDGKLELVGGNVVFKVDIENKSMTPLWKRSDHPDGYPAVADLDLNGTPELVVVRNSNATLMAFDAKTGTDFWPSYVKYSVGGGGTPTIANMNDTPEPEIAFAGVSGNIVLDYQGNTLWTRGSHDTSSGRTGSSVFDFDGDGKAEVVYADEYFLRVYDGKTGETRFCECNTTCTHYEYPVIADVNADGHAEILISANNSCSINNCPSSLTEKYGKDSCTDAIMAKGAAALKGQHGVRAFSSPERDWVNTRKVYNQHAYNVTNVSDDCSIPKAPRKNWNVKNLNNFRLNVQPGASYLPDLEISNVSTPRSCGSTTPLYFNVKNVGWATAVAGVPVNIWYTNASGETILAGTVKTSKDLSPGSSESLSFGFELTSEVPNPANVMLTFTEEVPIECRSDNNQTNYVLLCAIL